VRQLASTSEAQREDAAKRLHDLLATSDRARVFLEAAKLGPACDVNFELSSGEADDKSQLKRAAINAGALPRLAELLPTGVGGMAALVLGCLASEGAAAIIAAGAAPPLIALVRNGRDRPQLFGLLAIRALAAAGQGAAFEELVEPLLALLADSCPAVLSTSAALALLEMHSDVSGGEKRRGKVAAAALRHLLRLCAAECARFQRPAAAGERGAARAQAAETQHEGHGQESGKEDEEHGEVLALMRATLMGQIHSRHVAAALVSEPACLSDLLAMLEPSYAARFPLACHFAYAAAYALVVLLHRGFHGLRLDAQLAGRPEVLAPLLRLLQTKGPQPGGQGALTE
jgi:hypothetical protein